MKINFKKFLATQIDEKKFKDSTGLYSIRLHKESGEYHIFDTCRRDVAGGCHCSDESICEKMTTADGAIHVGCITDAESRKECLKLARRACGICVSKLYGDFPDS